MRYLISCLLVLCFTLPAIGNTIKVPQDFQTIQAAIDRAAKGDLILVDPGTYLENIDFKGKDIQVKSTQGHIQTIIDGGQAGSVVTFSGVTPQSTLLEGFTITNGQADQGSGIFVSLDSKPVISKNLVIYNHLSFISSYPVGGGIFCPSPARIESNEIAFNGPVSSVSGCRGAGVFCGNGTRLLNNRIFNNLGGGEGRGAGVYCFSQCEVSGNEIVNNSGCFNGGGVYAFTHHRVILSDNALVGNSAHNLGGGIYIASNGKWGKPIRNCLIRNNSVTAPGGMGGAIYVMGSALIQNCTIVNNQAVNGAGGGVHADGLIQNCIIRDNTASSYPEYSGKAEVKHSNVKGGAPGIGNIDADPMFYDPANGWFHLIQGPGVVNPCVDTGFNFAMNLGLDTNWTAWDKTKDTGMADMGYHYGPISRPALSLDQYRIVASLGGKGVFTLDTGLENPHQDYIMFGGGSGVSPGFILPSGVVLPVNVDLLTGVIYSLHNTSLFVNFRSNVDAWGRGMAEMNLSPMILTSGLTLHFAFAATPDWEFASNPVRVDIVP